MPIWVGRMVAKDIQSVRSVIVWLNRVKQNQENIVKSVPKMPQKIVGERRHRDIGMLKKINRHNYLTLQNDWLFHRKILGEYKTLKNVVEFFLTDINEMF